MNANQITDRLHTAGFDSFIVGGAVRDILTGSVPKDIDLVTNARPAELIELFSDAKVNHVGKSFGVVIIDGIEVATYRFDVHAGCGDANCSVEYADNIHEDLRRRDLTINAMAICTTSGDLVDNHGGRHDLANRNVRFVGSAERRIFEDPNRIVRACRFLAKIEGTFNPETLESLRRNRHMVRDLVAPERIRLEILKAMELDHPSLFFAALETIGALKYIFPQLSRAVNHDHGNHHTENVFEHQMLAGDYASKKDPLLRLAAFLHDYGKPQAFLENLDNPKQNFVNHETIGARLLREDLESLKFTNAEVDRVTALVRSHMYVLSDISDKAFRRLLQKFSDRNVDWKDFLRLRFADRSGALAHPPFPLSDWKVWVDKFRNGLPENAAVNVHGLAISGGELIREFGLRPGPLVGQLQKFLLEFVLEEGFENNNPETLREIAERFLEEGR